MRNNKGITLIALVITIIVLLILAGVSIAMLTGENGILTQANNSKYSTARAEAVERINLALNAVKTQIYAERVNAANWDPLTSSHDLQQDIKETLAQDGFVEKTASQTGSTEGEIEAGYYYWLDYQAGGSGTGPTATLYVEYRSKAAADIDTPIAGHIILTNASLTLSEATLPTD